MKLNISDPAVNQSSFAERQENSNQIKQGNLNHVAGQKRPARLVTLHNSATVNTMLWQLNKICNRLLTTTVPN